MGRCVKAIISPRQRSMGLSIDEKLPLSPLIPAFPVENQQPRLSIKPDDADIGCFYNEYYSLVFNRCLVILGNREDAQDATHDIFEKLQSFKSKGQFNILYPKTYLFKAAGNMGINKKIRARKELNHIYDMATNGSLCWFRGNEEKCIFQSKNPACP